MRTQIRNHLSPPLLLALLALFAALGGGAYAASTVKKNSVDSKSVVNNSLKGGDIQNETLTGADVRDNTLSGDDIENGSIRPGDLAGGGAVTGAAIVDNSVTGADIDESTLDINEAALDVSRVVARARGTGSTPVVADTNGLGNPPDPLTDVPLTGNTYQRVANQTDSLFGSFTATFPADCNGAVRSLSLLITDGSDPIAFETVVSTTDAEHTVPGFIEGNDATIEAGAKSRTLTATASATCDAGSTANPSISDVKLNVEGVR